jgi:hypothetical protein
MLRLRFRLSLYVKRPLERELIERTHPREPWDRRIYALKIREIERISERLQLLAKFRTEPRLPRLDARARSPLTFTERKVVGYVGDGLDAHLLKFLGGTGVESRQIADVVIWEREIAAVKEFTRDGVRAMETRRNVWSLRHNEDTKF